MKLVITVVDTPQAWVFHASPHQLQLLQTIQPHFMTPLAQQEILQSKLVTGTRQSSTKLTQSNFPTSSGWGL